MATDHHFYNTYEAAVQFQHDLTEALSKHRNIPSSEWLDEQNKPKNIEAVLYFARKALSSKGQQRQLDVDALEELSEKIFTSPSYGGLGVTRDMVPASEQYAEIMFQTEAYLESVNSRLNSNDFLHAGDESLHGARPMTLAEKIFMQHALDLPAGRKSLHAGEVIRAGVDWILASELSWKSMAKTYEALGAPGIWRNDRFWLAGDHVVHPTIIDEPKIKTYIEVSEKAKRDFKMTQYQGMNYTIMHTEFVRERAEPGMLAVGSDSHSCSAGAVGCLSIGLGAADVMMTLALGETWWKVPESVSIEFVGRPAFGISGKDVILNILQQFKRNTIAAERIVEFSGEGTKYLSSDARFAICNMCTEFGAITGVFVPDAATKETIDKRKRKANKSSSIYFRPDPAAQYAEKRQIDLSKIEPSVAIYPKPDHVVPVSEKAGLKLDGVFIGACTTTEEELVLAALVLKVGLQRGLPLAPGKRHYVPGSLPIVEKLRELKLLQVYEAAGFTRGPPGCSMCVGLTAEKAESGETWLSSQNRNFKNRMGAGAFGHVSTAVVCAASSFSLTITDPSPLLADLDAAFFKAYKGTDISQLSPLTYSEPRAPKSRPNALDSAPSVTASTSSEPDLNPLPDKISSKVITLGDFIDTDALAPGESLTVCTTDAEFAEYCLIHVYPEFRERVRGGQQVVVAGRAMGVGSSRENAVMALKGTGVQAVIARSYAFIYGRNQPNLGMLGIVMEDEEFYNLATDEADIEIDLPGRKIHVGGKTFEFELSKMEEQLTRNRGVTRSFAKYGKALWQELTKGGDEEGAKEIEQVEADRGNVDSRLNW